MVYGLLDPSDTIQLIRVERAFIDPVTSALVLAKDPEVLFYDDNTRVSVRNIATEEEFTLRRINGGDIGFPRDEGVFVDTPNILYAIDTDALPLDSEQEYQLRVTSPDDTIIVSAETNIVGESGFIRPIATNPSLDFGNFSTLVAFRWRSGQNASIYDLDLRFNYQERTASTDWENQSVQWAMATNLPDDPIETIEEHLQDGESFYSFLFSSIPEESDKIRRFVNICLLYTSPSPRDRQKSRMPSSA